MRRVVYIWYVLYSDGWMEGWVGGGGDYYEDWVNKW